MDEQEYQIVLVKWADAHTGEGGWHTIEDYEDDGECIVETVGFLIPPTESGGKKGHVTIWQTLKEGDGIHPMHIPDGMVRTIQFLKAFSTEISLLAC